MIKILKNLYQHPVRKYSFFLPFINFIKWQLLTLFYKGYILYEWVDDIKFIVRKGDYGFTGNIYTIFDEFYDMLFLLSITKPENLFIDVGANIGSFTTLVGKICKCEVISFEPSTDAFNQLKKNVYINGLESNVSVHNLAVSDKEDTLLFTNNLSTENHVVNSPNPSENIVKVSSISLDNFVKTKKSIILKIDTEGFELNVLKGSFALLREQVFTSILLESNLKIGHYNETESEIIKFLSRFHYFPVNYDFDNKRVINLEFNSKKSKNIIFIKDKENINSILQENNFNLKTVF